MSTKDQATQKTGDVAPAPAPAQRAPTAFEQRVYALCEAIPRGRVSTYGRVAAALKCGSARAVGQALKRNPFAPAVPCHRVVSATQDIGGFSGESSPCAPGGNVARKRAMLVEEGVRFEADDQEMGAEYWRIASACVLSEQETVAIEERARGGGGGGGRGG